ncbi:MAG TPA: hypothetical protein VJ768_00940 [Anaerolineales bacterium]|nr:hypothetical protein [Anaerolineales bacterium]
MPLWLIFLATLGIVLLSSELGWRYGDYRRRKSEDEKAPVGAAVGAILALLGFLLAFTFGMATSRYDSRKQIVVQEANAIGTAYLRSEFLSEEEGEMVRELLREYAALGGSQPGPEPAGDRPGWLPSEPPVGNRCPGRCRFEFGPYRTLRRKPE